MFFVLAFVSEKCNILLEKGVITLGLAVVTHSTGSETQYESLHDYFKLNP